MQDLDIIKDSQPSFVSDESDARSLQTFTRSSGTVRAVRPAKAAAAPPVSEDDAEMTLEALGKMETFKEYQRAFTSMTGMPLSLRPVGSWMPAHRKARGENEFCAMMAQSNSTCAACLQLQAKLCQQAVLQSKTMVCQAGMCEMAVPIRLGQKLIGFLQTGQVFVRKPDEADFKRASKTLIESDKIEEHRLREAYFQTRVLNARERASVQKLLDIFAEHLSIISNQVVTLRENSEPESITRAKQFIRDNITEDISLDQVAKASHTSKFYFCKLFHKATGLTFTNYLARVRVEKAKQQLLNPNMRVCEVAFAVGFQSLTHFNRVFRRIAGQSPSAYRSSLARG